MANKGKKLITIPFTRERKYVSKFTYQLWEGFTKKLLPILAIIAIGAMLYLGFAISLVIRNNQPSSDAMVNPIVRAVEPTPTPKQLCYTPKKSTRNLINKNPGFSSRLKEKFGECDWLYVAELLDNESSWNPGAINPSSGACGLFQAYRCEKMKCELTDVDCQLEWGYQYITNRYGSAKNALEFWKANKANGNGWY